MIAAFDLASVTGVCFGETTPTVATWKLIGEQRPAKLRHLHDLTTLLFKQIRPTLVVYEAPLPLVVMARVGARDETIALLRGAIGVLELLCAVNELPVQALSVQDARESVLGWRTHRGAGKTKDKVIRHVTAFYGITPQNDNEADAFVLWRYAQNLANPRLAAASTPLFRG